MSGFGDMAFGAGFAPYVLALSLPKLLRETDTEVATSPWLALSRGGNPDYSAAFAAVLKQAIRPSVGAGDQSHG